MSNNNFINDFLKVVKVLNSCTTEKQIEIADNFFDLFLSKYLYIMNKQYKSTITNHYNKLKKYKISKTLKKI